MRRQPTTRAFRKEVAPFPKRNRSGSGIALGAALLCFGSSALAHPHVFVDGGLDFVMGDENVLEALDVTWRYDAFETLYILATYGMSLDATGSVSEAERQALVRFRSMWPTDFDGSAHLQIDGTPIALAWPTALDAEVTDGRLEVTFTRALEQPHDLTQRLVNVAFYESTYFFAFSMTDAPAFLGPATCETTVIEFDPDEQDAKLLSVLARLGREETPDIENVGAYFADRIEMQCG